MYIVDKFNSFTFKEIFIRGTNKLYRELSNFFHRNIDKMKDSRVRNKEVLINKLYINEEIFNMNIKCDNLREICLNFIEHEFDLLGSGLVKVSYDTKCQGVEGKKYRMNLNLDFNDSDWLKQIILKPYVKYSKSILKNIDDDYIFIDWQLDFKSGYRYDSRKWYKDQEIGKDRGADIKVPWELSRMQHLVQMSIGAVNFIDLRERLILEFKNQILDFIATNPVRMGVNWACTMDVAIRVSNWLLAYDIILSIDKNNILNDEFKKIFTRSIYDHGKFIINNLEWDYGNRANHYLANIAGLLFVSAYLDRSKETDAWLVFATQELINEMDYQFLEDGGNFEGSTAYHRLSGEIMIFSTALLYGVLNTEKKNAFKDYESHIIKRLNNFSKQKYNLKSNDFFPDLYLDRLFKIGLFMSDIVKQNGRILQIGDNDSGRFIKLTPVGNMYKLNEIKEMYANLKEYNGIYEKDMYFDEDILNNKPFISLFSGLFLNEEFDKYNKEFFLENIIINTLSNKKKLLHSLNINKDIEISNKKFLDLKYEKTHSFYYNDYKLDKIDLKKIKSYIYQNFGLVIFKSEDIYLSMYFGENGQNGNGGHAHNDKLSIELVINNIDILTDPGTYLYTAFPEKRNIFRSNRFHNNILVDNEEQCKFNNLFSLRDETKCSIVDIGNYSLTVSLHYRNIIVLRKINILVDRIIISDKCNKKFIQQFNNNSLYSNGYGKLMKNKNYIGE